jgi:hypothetical protein
MSPETTNPAKAAVPPSRHQQRIPFDTFLKEYGRTRATGHEWRRRLPWLDVKNIFGRLYISLDSVRRFEEMAARGELAVYRPAPEPRRRRRPSKQKAANH